MSHVRCELCGFYCYETATPGVFKCSGCGDITNNWTEDGEND